MPNELQETRNTVKMKADRIAQLEEDLRQEHAALQAERAGTFAVAATEQYMKLWTASSMLDHSTG